MEYIITDSRGNQIVLEPKLALYSVRDFTGKEMPGLAIDLIDITNKDDPVEYHSLTVSFGEFIGMKNCAYVDTNNCSFAEQLLKQGIATPNSVHENERILGISFVAVRRGNAQSDGCRSI